MKRLPNITTLMILAAYSTLGPGTLALADPPTIWTVQAHIERVNGNQGNDVYWTSPTAVDNTAPWYHGAYEITEISATVQYWILPPFDIDVIGYLDPADLTGDQIALGPPPIVLSDEYFLFPEPPAPVAIAAHVYIELDADGYGQAAVTEVYLGQYDLEGWGIVEVLAIDLEVVVTVTPLRYGDMNCDGIVNSYDIDGFICAVSPTCDFDTTYPGCTSALADCNQDGAVNAYDIDAFIDAVGGG